LNRRIVITGTGIVTALGKGREINREKMLAGVSAIRSIKAFDSRKYRSGQGGEAREFVEADLYNLDSKRLDRATHLLIGATREALTEAGMCDTVGEMPVLVCLGTTLGGMLSGQSFHREALEKGLLKARTSLLSDHLAACQAINLFREFKLRGDYRILSDACASGTNAIGHAFRSLRSGEYDIAICGGYDTMSEFTFAGFNSLMVVSPGLCRPFDKNRNGLVLGEGSGMLVLEELEHAIKRGAAITGEIMGYGESSDGYHMTTPEPDGKGASAAICGAMADAGNPDIHYINAHGTGTVLNDIVESRAIVRALGETAVNMPVSSIKPMIGHLLGAAGAVEAIATLFAIRHKTPPPNINFETPDPECPLNIVTRPHERHEVRIALSNSFGFGGSNASIILGEFR